MGMRTRIRVIASPYGFLVGTAILADDRKIRCDSVPAGMAKAALVHATIQVHHKNVLWLVPPRCGQILDCPAAYHDFLMDVNEFKAAKRVDPRVKKP